MDRVLGNRVAAPENYAPEVLVPIDRAQGRAAIDDASEHVSNGWDVWHCYELSWMLEGAGVSYFTGTITIPADSPSTVESKSLKLYLNSLNKRCFSSHDDAVQTITDDLSAVAAAAVTVSLWSPAELAENTFTPKSLPQPEVSQNTQRWLLSGFRSLCPVTAQPDWATIVVDIDSVALDAARIESAVESLRNHQGFHEQCIEDVFTRIEHALQPDYLLVTGYFQRRGGIDITPRRSSATATPPIERLYEQ